MNYIEFITRLKRIMPTKAYLKIQRHYRIFKRKITPNLSEEEFRNILINKLGLHKGAVVFIHSSMDNLNIAFPFYRLLSLVLDIVGRDEGTVLFPTTQISIRAEEYLSENIDQIIFDVKKSPTTRGILPEFARRQKKAIRSLHPTDSVVAIGKYARELTENHEKSLYPTGENSPFYKIMKHDGIIIGLGVGTYNLSFVHCVEDVMQEKFPIKTRKDEVFECRIRDYAGDVQNVKTLVANDGIGKRDIPSYIKMHIPDSVCKDLKINSSNFFYAKSQTLFDMMRELASKNITIYK